MATALDIIKGALRRLQAYQSGDVIAAPDANDALTTLNDLLDSWSTDHAYVYAVQEYVLTFTPGQYQYTIGPAGQWNTDNTGLAISRPLRIVSAFSRINTGGQQLDYGMEIVDGDRYRATGIKSLPAPWPEMLYYNPTYPTGTLYFYQAPNQNSELHLFADTILSQFPTLSTTVTLPQGGTVKACTASILVCR